jgi:hypothetical protein
MLTLQAGEQHHKYAQSGQAGQPTNALQGIGIATGKQQPRCADGDHLKREDLDVQCRGSLAAERQADAAETANTINKWLLFSGMATILGLFFTYWQGRQAMAKAAEGNRLARDAMVADNRAWLQITKVQYQPWLTGDPDPTMMIYATVKNIGKTVARNVRVGGVITTNYHTQEKGYFVPYERDTKFAFVMKMPLFPGEEAVFMAGASFDGIQEKVLAHVDSRRGLPIYLYPVVFCLYRTVFDGPNDPDRVTDMILRIAEDEEGNRPFMHPSDRTIGRVDKVYLFDTDKGDPEYT